MSEMSRGPFSYLIRWAVLSVNSMFPVWTKILWPRHRKGNNPLEAISKPPLRLTSNARGVALTTPLTSHFKTFNRVRDQGGVRRTTTVIVGYFEDWPPHSNAEIGPERRFLNGL